MNHEKQKFVQGVLFTIVLLLSACGGGGGNSTASSIAPDMTPPTVSITTPASSATGVAVNSAITATFSEAMTASTITASTFTLSGGVGGTVTYDATNKIATFTPSASLAYSTTYTATITTGVKDSAGNAMTADYTWSFTTGVAPDTTPPAVSVTTPANNATGVAVNSVITAAFSEAVMASTITASTFTLSGGVGGTVTYDAANKIATFTPAASLAYSTTYTATITAGVKDSAGNAMAADYTWSFTTGAAPDTTPPVVSATTPANNATGVAVNSVITATFSEAMLASTITPSTFTLGRVTGTVAYSGTTATFTPASNLAYSTAYTATISTGVKDAAGNAMTANYTWSFTTSPAPAATTAEVTISAAATSGGAWSGANPDVFTANTPLATVSVTDIENRLNAGIPVTIAASTAAGGNGDIDVNGAISWSTNAMLTLSAYRNVNVNSNITATGNAAGLALSPRNTGLGSGTYNLNNGSVITLSGTTPSLSIASITYTVINDVTALQNMSSFLAKKYALGSNIDASATSAWNTNAGFVPVGDTTNGFTGILDGLNHTITGLTINRPGQSYIGLFGVTNNTSVVIRNVGLVGASITGYKYVGGLVGSVGGDPTWATKYPAAIANCYVTGGVTGASYVGGLVGYMFGYPSNGSISASYAASNVTGVTGYLPYYIGGLIGYNEGGTISKSYSTGAVTGSSDHVGGLAGTNAGTINYAYASGTVTGGGNYAGGLAGSNAGTITSSYSTGSVGGVDSVGGLVGANAGTIANTYSTGALSGTTNTGGLVGNNTSTVTSSYWDTQTSGTSAGIGGGTLAGATGLVTSLMKTQSSFAGWDFANTWKIIEGVSYPTLLGF